MRALGLILAAGTFVWVPGCGQPDPVANNAAGVNLSGVNLPAHADDSNPDPQGGPPANEIGFGAGGEGEDARRRAARQHIASDDHTLNPWSGLSTDRGAWHAGRDKRLGKVPELARKIVVNEQDT